MSHASRSLSAQMLTLHPPLPPALLCETSARSRSKYGMVSTATGACFLMAALLVCVLSVLDSQPLFIDALANQRRLQKHSHQQHSEHAAADSDKHKHSEHAATDTDKHKHSEHAATDTDNHEHHTPAKKKAILKQDPGEAKIVTAQDEVCYVDAYTLMKILECECSLGAIDISAGIGGVVFTILLVFCFQYLGDDYKYCQACNVICGCSCTSGILVGTLIFLGRMFCYTWNDIALTVGPYLFVVPPCACFWAFCCKGPKPSDAEEARCLCCSGDTLQPGGSPDNPSHHPYGRVGVDGYENANVISDLSGHQ